jgi:hypothetical protein
MAGPDRTRNTKTARQYRDHDAQFPASSFLPDGEATEPRNKSSNTFEKEGHMRQAKYRFFLLPLFFVLACVGLYAQANSELTGVVSDQTGAVVAGAKLVLTDPATGIAHTATSGATGLYDINGLNPGTYNQGFPELCADRHSDHRFADRARGRQADGRRRDRNGYGRGRCPGSAG